MPPSLATRLDLQTVPVTYARAATELPYGVRGLCRNWQGGHAERGPIRHPPTAYRSRMVVMTWFGAFTV